jgi:hypothetical protein
MAVDTNSMRTRVLPVFGWLTQNGGTSWPSRLLQICHGFASDLRDCGPLLKEPDLESERVVHPTNARLQWMLENVDCLAPRDGHDYGELCGRVADRARIHDAIGSLRLGLAIEPHIR